MRVLRLHADKVFQRIYRYPWHLLLVYLRWPKVDAAAKIVENCLIEQDLDPNDAVVRSLDGYLAKLPSGTDPNALLGALDDIKPPAARPFWQKILKQWMIRFGKATADTNSVRNGT